MIRGIALGLMSLLSLSAFSNDALNLFSPLTFLSCAKAKPIDDPGFCKSFKEVAECYCVSSGLPKGMCNDMNFLYSQMISYYHSQDAACGAQRYTDKKTCMDNWDCYRIGKNSQGKKCGANGNPCETS